MLSNTPSLTTLNLKRNNDKHPWTKRQIATFALTTVGIALFGLYFYNRYQRNKNYKNKHVNKHIQSTIQKSKQLSNIIKKEAEIEIEIESYDLAWGDIKDNVLSIFEELIENNIQKNDIKILVVDNGFSKVPINIYQDGYHNITVCDMSQSVINEMKSKYSEQCRGINWISYVKEDVLDHKLQQILSQSYHLIIHKDSSETFSGKTITPENDEILFEKFKQLSAMLIEQIIKGEDNDEYSVFGKYLLLSPRRKVPYIEDKILNWSVRRVTAIGYDINAKQYAKTPFLYWHTCTKLGHGNQSAMIKKSHEDRRHAIEQNDSGNIVINDISFKKTRDDKTVITFINLKENADENENKNTDIDFERIKNEELKTKSIYIRHLNLTFEPTIVVENIETDILIKYSKYENTLFKAGPLFDQVPYYFMIHGIIVAIRKFAKNIVFYDVKLFNHKDDEDAVTIQCITEKNYIHSLNNPKLSEEFETNFLTQVNDEIKVFGVLGTSQKRILSIFSQYTALIQQK